MSLRIARPPQELLQPDRHACVTCMTAQVLYVWGLLDRVNPKVVADLDRQLGRPPNQDLPDPDAHFYLLQRGLRLYEYDAFDPHAFLREGLSYLRRDFGAKWSKEHERRFTPAEVARQQRLTRLDLERRRPYARQLRRWRRMPTMQDIYRMVRRGMIVDVTLDAIGYDHAGLIVPHASYPDGSTVWLYAPDTEGQTVYERPLSRLSKWIQLDWGVTGITLW